MPGAQLLVSQHLLLKMTLPGENQSRKWWAVNVGTFESDFRKIVSPELARHVVEKLRAGETVEFPNRYELKEVRGRFGGSWKD